MGQVFGRGFDSRQVHFLMKVRIIQNNGIVEEVKHFHLHIKPAYLNEDNLVIRNVEDIYNIIKTY